MGRRLRRLKRGRRGGGPHSAKKHLNLKGFAGHMKPFIRKEVWWSLFIAFIMIFSAFGVMFYGFSSPSTTYRYNDVKFTATQQGFAATLEGKKWVFDHFPGDLEEFNVSASLAQGLRGTKMAYLTYNPNQTTVAEIASSQFRFQESLQQMGIYAAPAMTSENEYGLPVITCRNATGYVPVIDFRETNTSGIRTEGSCILLEAAYPEDFSKLTDRIVFGMLGVMK